MCLYRKWVCSECFPILLATVIGLATKGRRISKSLSKRGFLLVLFDGLTVQALATIIFDDVNLASNVFLSRKRVLSEHIDISLCSSKMSISFILLFAFQFPRSTRSSRFQHLVCLLLVSYEA